jgi:glycerophosphoryl diester phosphodiesterase
MKILRIITFLIASLLLSCSTSGLDKDARDFELIAHRGFAGLHTENTIHGLLSSIELGADAIEFDVSMSREGTAYLFHDEYVDEITTGSGKFLQLRDAEIEKLEYIDRETAKKTGFSISRLEDLLQTIQTKPIHMYPEIKQVRNTDDIITIINLIDSYGFLEESTIQTFNSDHVRIIKEHNPDIRVGYLISSSRDLEELKQKVQQMNTFSHITILTNYNNILRFPEFAEFIREQGMDIGVWTVNEASHIKTLTYFGVDKIMSDVVLE